MRQEVHDKLDELLTLGANWNSYGALPVNQDQLEAMRKLLGKLMSYDTPTPDIVPTSFGGVQAEWCLGGVDFEIETEADGRFACLDESGDDSNKWVVWSTGGTDDKLRELIAKLPRREQCE